MPQSDTADLSPQLEQDLEPCELAPFCDLAHLGPQPEPSLEPCEPAPDDGIREIFPSDPDYIASIYIDAERHWGEAQLAQLQARYAADHPGRTLRLHSISREALRYQRLSLFPEMEQLFLQQGHVCDLEARGFGENGRQQVLFERHQRDALDMSVFMLWEMLRVAGQDLNLWDAQGDRTAAQHAEIVENEINLQLGHLLGSYSGRRGDRQSEVALVEHAGLLLGCERVGNGHRIHLAETAAPRTAWRAAQQAEICRALFGRSPEAIQAQVAREVRNAAIVFDHRRDWPDDHAERLARGETIAPVTPGSVLTWYSQVLTALRKAAWEASARGSAAVAGYAVRREAEVHPNPVGVAARPRRHRTACVRDYVNQAADLLAQHLTDAHGTWIVGDQVTARFDPEQWLTAALHGSTLDHDEPLEEPEADRALAAWIGTLKRTGHEYLDHFDAERLLDLLDEPSALRSRVFFGQFSEAVWLTLIEAARAVDAGNGILEVTYAWCEDPAEPWAVERTAKLLAIRGPLLSFPACEAAEWARKAAFIRRQEAFLAPPAHA